MPVRQFCDKEKSGKVKVSLIGLYSSGIATSRSAHIEGKRHVTNWTSCNEDARISFLEFGVDAEDGE